MFQNIYLNFDHSFGYTHVYVEVNLAWSIMLGMRLPGPCSFVRESDTVATGAQESEETRLGFCQ